MIPSEDETPPVDETARIDVEDVVACASVAGATLSLGPPTTSNEVDDGALAVGATIIEIEVVTDTDGMGVVVVVVRVLVGVVVVVAAAVVVAAVVVVVAAVVVIVVVGLVVVVVVP